MSRFTAPFLVSRAVAPPAPSVETGRARDDANLMSRFLTYLGEVVTTTVPSAFSSVVSKASVLKKDHSCKQRNAPPAGDGEGHYETIFLDESPYCKKEEEQDVKNQQRIRLSEAFK